MSQVSEPELKVTLTVPLIHTKSRSRKNDRLVTRGFYLNIPKTIIERLDLHEHELVELTIKKTEIINSHKKLAHCEAGEIVPKGVLFFLETTISQIPPIRMKKPRTIVPAKLAEDCPIRLRS